MKRIVPRSRSTTLRCNCRGERARRRAGSLQERLRRRPQRRRERERVARRRREAGETRADELLQRRRNRQRLERVDILVEHAGELQREERIPARLLMDAQQRLACERPPEAVVKEPVQRTDAERSDPAAVRRPPPARARTAPAGGRRPAGRLPSRRRSAKASALADEESSHWTSSIATTTGLRSLSRPRTSRTATASARWSATSSAAFVAQKRDLERAPSRRRQLVDHVVEYAVEEIAEPDVREPALGLGRTRRRARESHVRRAAATAASQSVDFPIPGSPSSTSPEGASTGVSRNV